MNQIEKFKSLINQNLYYEAHEALEELWFPIRKVKDDYCLLLKGFINGSVSLELLKRNKIEQSKKIYLIYKKYVTMNRLNTINNIELIKLKQFMDEKFKEQSIYPLQTRNSKI